MSSVLVSALITTYNRSPKILERALSSVSNQTYPNLEIIVVNDSPNYEKRKEIDELAIRFNVKYIVNEANIGAGASRNKAFLASNGEYVAFLDDDDEWLPDKIKCMIPMFDSKTGLVYCNLINEYKGKKTGMNLPSYSDEIVIEKLLETNFVGGYSGPVIRRSVMEAVGLMDEKLLSQQDSDLWRRIALVSSIKHCEAFLTVYHQSNESITGNRVKRLNGTIMMLDKYDKYYEKYPKAKAIQLSGTIQNFMKVGWYREAIIVFKKYYHGFDALIHLYFFPLGFLKGIVKKILGR